MARGYRTYRGRSRGRTRFPLFFTLIFLLVAIVLLFFGLQDAIVFSSDGILFRNPFDTGEPKESLVPSPSKTPELVVVTPSSSPTPTPTPTPTPKNETILNAVYLPSLTDPVAVAGVIQLADKGVINAVVIDMKHGDGTLSYTSTVEVAVLAGANPEQDIARSVIQELKGAGLYLVGRMSAFKDDRVPRKIQSASVKVSSGVIWLDAQYHGWMNPYLEEAQGYITSIATELAALGFDEILLENFTFPTIGRPQLINYGEFSEVSRTETLTTYAEELREMLSDKDAVLSINVASTAILNGSDSTTGQDATSLFSTVERIYTDVGTDSGVAQQIHAKVFDTLQSLVTTGSNTSSGNVNSNANANTRFVPIIHSPRSYDDPSASENIQVAIGTFVPKAHGWLILDPTGLYPSAGW